MLAPSSIEDTRLLEAKVVSPTQADEETTGGDGIYRGTKLQWTKRVYSPEAAGWVRDEIWHERQKTRVLEEGKYELRVPHADPRRLAMAFCGMVRTSR